MSYKLLLHCCQSRNSACPVVVLRRYVENKKHVKLIIRYIVITRKGGRLDLADVQHILELDCFSVHLFAGWKCSPRQPGFFFFLSLFLPALCIINTLVYFFPRKVRRSVLSSLNSLSHSPKQTTKQTQRTDILNTQCLRMNRLGENTE